ncbi:MAG: Rrf2 family transcriptional regulator, partial [Oscillospiraceae bacterium]|nr:Rrf2 family transcriptional regulator [Oscillospiraceae bacterium]
KYLEQIIQRLCSAGLVKSLRGSQGGYMLPRDPKTYTAGDILRAIEGNLAPIACLEQTPNPCERYSICPAVRFWEGLYETIEGYVNAITLQDLADHQPVASAIDFSI